MLLCSTTCFPIAGFGLKNVIKTFKCRYILVNIKYIVKANYKSIFCCCRKVDAAINLLDKTFIFLPLGFDLTLKDFFRALFDFLPLRFRFRPPPHLIMEKSLNFLEAVRGCLKVWISSGGCTIVTSSWKTTRRVLALEFLLSVPFRSLEYLFQNFNIIFVMLAIN